MHPFKPLNARSATPFLPLRFAPSLPPSPCPSLTSSLSVCLLLSSFSSLIHPSFHSFFSLFSPLVLHLSPLSYLVSLFPTRSVFAKDVMHSVQFCMNVHANVDINIDIVMNDDTNICLHALYIYIYIYIYIYRERERERER